MDNLKICVGITTSEKSISTEPPGAVEGYFTQLIGRKLLHAHNFLRQIIWYDLQRIYNSELKLQMVRMHQLE